MIRRRTIAGYAHTHAHHPSQLLHVPNNKSSKPQFCLQVCLSAAQVNRALDTKHLLQEFSPNLYSHLKDKNFK